VATGGRVPDRTLLFDLPPAVARSRGACPGRSTEPHERRLDDETLAFYGRARDGFLELARSEPERFRVVDSSGTRAETARQVRAALADLLDLPGQPGQPGRPGDAAAGAEETGG